MRLYDEYGREVFAESMDFTVSDSRYLRKDTSDISVAPLYTFDISGSTFRIKNGKIQVKNDTNGLWYYVGCQTIDNIPTFYLSDTGEV